MKLLKVLMILLIAVALPSAVRAETGDLVIGVANNHIDVTVGFSGSSIEVFGDRRDKETDVAIVMEGPRKNVTIWQKSRIIGTWVNRYYMKFKDIPTYYSYAISVQGFSSSLLEAMQENGIGHEALFYKTKADTSRKLKDERVYKDALLKKNQELGVFFQQPATIKFMNDHFFRVRFDLPPSAPTGEYKIHSFLIKDGKVIGKTLELLTVEQVGLNAFIYKAAHEYSLIYALVCIFLALFCGWLAGAVRVKP